MDTPTDWEPDKTGRLGLALNHAQTIVTMFVCSECFAWFTVTGDITEEQWGTACLAATCPSYDPGRDVDGMFPDDPEHGMKGWWAISAERLMWMLNAVAAGADPELVYIEEYANSDVEDVEGEQ